MSSIYPTDTQSSPRTKVRTPTLGPGWWVLPSIIGGTYLWSRILLATFG